MNTNTNTTFKFIERCLNCGDTRVESTPFCMGDIQNGKSVEGGLGMCGDLHKFPTSGNPLEPCGRCALGAIEVGCLYPH